MKIAVPVKENNQIDAHFGHCEFYQIYEVSDKNEVLSIHKMDSPQGCGCKSNIAEVFQNEGVKFMLAGGIGDGAISILNAHGISVVRNCSGDVSVLVQQYLSGELKDGGSNCQSHAHDHICDNH